MLDTLSNVKARLGITVSTYDAFLTQQIQLVSDVIEAYCRRKFITANYKQTFYIEDSVPSWEMKLFHFPVQSVASVVEDTVVRNTSTYRLNSPSGVLTVPRFFGSTTVPFFYPFVKVTEVTYTAGYNTCPPIILSVLDDVIQERYNKKASGVALDFGSDVQRISIPGAISIDFDYSLTNNDRTSAYGVILGSSVNVLDEWRSERAVVGSGKLQYVEAL